MTTTEQPTHARCRPGRPDRPRGAAPAVPRRARQAPPRRRQRAVPRADRPVRPLPRRPVRRAGRARAAVRRGHGGAHRRRLRRPRHRGPAEAGRRRRRPHHRGRRRRRRRLVLEPLPRGHVRHRGDDLPAAARGDRHMPTQKYTLAGEIFGHARRIATQFGLYDNALFSTEVTELDVGRRRVALDHPHRPRRRDPGAVRGHGHRTAAPAEAARHPGHRDLRGHSFHTSRWDYDYTGGDPTGAPLTGLADKRVGIIGTGATAVQCIPHLARDAAGALRVPAHAVVDRRPQQPRHRPRVVRRRSSRAGSRSG